MLGRPSLAESPTVAMRAAKALRAIPDVRFLSALRRGNVHGAMDAGLVPGFLPGRVTLDAGREWFTEAWGGQLPAAKGLDTQGILEAAAAGRIEVLVILGSDPVADFPDADLARRAIAGVKNVIAVGGFLTGTSRGSEVVLPPTLAGEKSGSVTNLEGRVQRVNRKVAPEGGAMDDWRIALELALRLGTEIDLATVDEVTDEIARVAPALAGVTDVVARRGRAMASCCRCATTATRSCSAPARCRSSPTTARARRGTRSRSRAKSRPKIESTRPRARPRRPKQPK